MGPRENAEAAPTGEGGNREQLPLQVKTLTSEEESLADPVGITERSSVSLVLPKPGSQQPIPTASWGGPAVDRGHKCCWEMHPEAENTCSPAASLGHLLGAQPPRSDGVVGGAPALDSQSAGSPLVYNWLGPPLCLFRLCTLP